MQRGESSPGIHCCGLTECRSVLRQLQPESNGSTGSARRQQSTAMDPLDPLDGNIQRRPRFASSYLRVGATGSVQRYNRPRDEVTVSPVYPQTSVQGMCCDKTQTQQYVRKYSSTYWKPHHIASFVVALPMTPNVRIQPAREAHLVLNRTVCRHSRTDMDFRRPWPPAPFRCPCCRHRLICVPVGFTVRIERSMPGVPGSPGGPPPGTPEHPAARMPSGGPGSPVLRSVSPEPAEAAAAAEPGPSDHNAATEVPLLAAGATVAAEASASAPSSSGAGVGSPDHSIEPPARRRRVD